MKNGMVMYEKLYQILKKKIECGILPNGSRLPSRAELSSKLGTSEKTVRRVVDMLAKEGLVETKQRQRPLITFNPAAVRKERLPALQRVNAIAAGDLLKTGIFICYPVISYGYSLCTGEEWRILESILNEMNPQYSKEFWRLSNQFWRFFICRTENDIIIRTVDGLGIAELDPLPGTFELRAEYYAGLKKIVSAMKCGGSLESIHFADLSGIYGSRTDREQWVPACRAAIDSPFSLGTKEFHRRIGCGEEQYSHVYLDILGQIAIGTYRPGDRLPSHDELRRTYGVSVDTTMKAVQVLKDWGIVTATRGKGIFVAMDLKTMSTVYIAPEVIACHIRRFLDSLQLLSLTVEEVAAHASMQATADEACELRDNIKHLWNHSYLYQFSPAILLEFIASHIKYEALQTIYRMILKNYHIGRSIPKLISHERNVYNKAIYSQCMETVRYLADGDTARFAEKAAEMFQYTHQLIIAECKRLGYWDAAAQVYDGSVLWK